MTKYFAFIICRRCNFNFPKTLYENEDKEIEHLSCPACKEFTLYIKEMEIKN